MNGHGAAPGFATTSNRTQLPSTLSTFITMYEPHEAREAIERQLGIYDLNASTPPDPGPT